MLIFATKLIYAWYDYLLHQVYAAHIGWQVSDRLLHSVILILLLPFIHMYLLGIFVFNVFEFKYSSWEKNLMFSYDKLCNNKKN